ncbi:MAG: Pr6Pr family membrane protein [Lachnospiraceae bacterium]|nr:Pr6Pr family membrane protein [Lachnospiraceae bacterium]
MPGKSERRERIRQIWNITIVVLVLYAWLIMFFNTEEGVLTSKGFINLKFYTTLSNIFAAIVAAAWTIGSVTKKNSRAMAVWKLTSAAAVGVTFLVVIGFLGPLYGFGSMYVGSNFFLHLVVPVLAMVEFPLFNNCRLSKKDNLFTMLPPLVYGTVYIINTLINGIRGNDIYGFLRWGYPVGLLIFAVICIVAYGVGCLLRIINAKLVMSEEQGTSPEQIPFDP